MGRYPVPPFLATCLDGLPARASVDDAGFLPSSAIRLFLKLRPQHPHSLVASWHKSTGAAAGPYAVESSRLRGADGSRRVEGIMTAIPEDYLVNASIHLIYPVEGERTDPADFARNLKSLVCSRVLSKETRTSRPTRSYADYFKKESYALAHPELDCILSTVLGGRGKALFRVNTWTEAVAGAPSRILPISVECELKFYQIDIRDLIESATAIDYGRSPLKRVVDSIVVRFERLLSASVDSRVRADATVRAGEARQTALLRVGPDLAARPRSMLRFQIPRKGPNLSETSYGRSLLYWVLVAPPSVLRELPSCQAALAGRHNSYAVVVIDLAPREETASAFVKRNFPEVLGLLLRPRYHYTKLNVQDEKVRGLRKNNFFSEGLYCNFTIRSGLIIYDASVDAGEYAHYVWDFLDVFRILRAVWAKASDVLFSLEGKFFAEPDEDPSVVYRDIKDLYELMNVAKIEFGSVKGARIYRDLFDQGVASFGITQSLESIDFITKVEELLSSRWAHKTSRSGGRVGYISLFISLGSILLTLMLSHLLNLEVGLAIGLGIVVLAVILYRVVWA